MSTYAKFLNDQTIWSYYSSVTRLQCSCCVRSWNPPNDLSCQKFWHNALIPKEQQIMEIRVKLIYWSHEIRTFKILQNKEDVKIIKCLDGMTETITNIITSLYSLDTCGRFSLKCDSVGFLI